MINGIDAWVPPGTVTETTRPVQKASEAGDIASKEMFLKLLVAQIKNQNPLSPADGVEFLSQLSQFTEVEQMMAMRKELETIRGALTPPSEGEAGEEQPAVTEP